MAAQTPAALLAAFWYLNPTTGKLSHTKFWSNIGHLVMTIAFIYEVTQGRASTDLWLVYGALVMGNATANKIINAKYNPADSTDAPTTGVAHAGQ